MMMNKFNTKRKSWTRLDNAGKIFPPSINKTDTQVFRLSAVLENIISPEILQEALIDTAKNFPPYQQVLRKGVFWFYLENTDILPVLREEYKTPCANIYHKSSKNLLYEVTYFHNRINLEVFHALSDAMGSVIFMSALVTKYISRLENIDEPPAVYHASRTQLSVDSFSEYYDNKVDINSSKLQNSCRIKGQKLLDEHLNLIMGAIPVGEIRAIAKSYGTTITVVLSALLMNAINGNSSVKARRKPIVLAVPVNLRGAFPSMSARNFFSVIYVSYHFKNNSTPLEDVIRSVDAQLKKGQDPENLTVNLNRYSAMEHNVIAKIVPLPIKNFVMRMAYLLSRRKVTAALSNIGIIKMPEQIKGIKAFELSAGTDGLQACVCSFENTLSIGFTSPFISADIQQSFFRSLSSIGVNVEVSSNMVSNEN